MWTHAGRPCSSRHGTCLVPADTTQEECRHNKMNGDTTLKMDPRRTMGTQVNVAGNGGVVQWCHHCQPHENAPRVVAESPDQSTSSWCQWAPCTHQISDCTQQRNHTCTYITHTHHMHAHARACSLQFLTHPKLSKAAGVPSLLCVVCSAGSVNLATWSVLDAGLEGARG